MDPVTLSAFLAPFLAPLMSGVQDLTEELGRKLGQEGWKYAKALWAKLRPGVEGDPAASAAAAAVASDPDNELARGGLAFQLEALLKADPSLSADVAKLWKEAEDAKVVNVVAEGDRSIAFHGKATNSVFSTGDNASIELKGDGQGSPPR